MAHPPCCSPSAPHPTIEATPRDGETHYVRTVMPGHSLPLSPAFAAMAGAGRRALDRPTVEELEQRIAAALDALKIPHPTEPFNAWVNSGNRWTAAAHRARIALGADE